MGKSAGRVELHMYSVSKYSYQGVGWVMLDQSYLLLDYYIHASQSLCGEQGVLKKDVRWREESPALLELYGEFFTCRENFLTSVQEDNQRRAWT